MRARSSTRSLFTWSTVAIAALAGTLGGTGFAEAQESHVHAEIAGGHAVGDPQQSEFGFGALGSLEYELRFGKVVGAQVQLDVYDLSQGSPPSNPAFAQHGQGFGSDALLGIRVRPFGALGRGDLWLAGMGGAGIAGSAVRAVLEARLGFDLVHLDSPNWEMGPFFGYQQVFQPSDTLRPEDAHVVWIGLHVDFLSHDHETVRKDRDGDGVFDDEDACIDAPGLRTSDPRTNGCPKTAPLDRDGDGITDDVDACPEVPGVASSDPQQNGCPVPDRDKDGILDKEDACPDVPGIRTNDPKTNGCPLPPDRDKDGVLDADDACPDVPGVHTEDPKTNGCPKASDVVRVEGDQILLNDIIHFETGSPRVHHASWPIVKKVADYIQATPDIEEVDIEGHADEVGTSEYNLYLSRERAASVKRLLVHFGVDPQRLTEHAYGKSRPREAGHDEKAHRENRRVEFTITRARAGTTQAQPRAPTPNGGP
ncbi:MAG TPA: OmpA family protein [Polyangiaceae bacterium]